MLGAGQRDRKITIQERDPSVTTRDEFGKPHAGWKDLVKVWAAVRELTVRDRMQAPGTLPVRSARMTIQHLPTITSTMRVLYDGAIWEIRGLAEMPGTGRRREMEIFAELVEVPGKV